MGKSNLIKSRYLGHITGISFRTIRRLARAGASVVKTEALRMDRLPDAEYEARLAVCRNCPGHHATFKKDGSLYTCGPMLASLKREGKGTCGCVLTKKARDTKESCPFGYWPAVKRTTLLRVSLTGRRNFIIKFGAVLGALAVLPAKALAADASVTRYIKITPTCDGNGSAEWVKCDEGYGKKVNQMFLATDNHCYKLTKDVSPVDGNTQAPSGQKTDVQAWADDCTQCQSAPCHLTDGSNLSTSNGDILVDGPHGNPTSGSFQSNTPYASYDGVHWYQLETSYDLNYIEDYGGGGGITADGTMEWDGGKWAGGLSGIRCTSSTNCHSYNHTGNIFRSGCNWQTHAYLEATAGKKYTGSNPTGGYSGTNINTGGSNNSSVS